MSISALDHLIVGSQDLTEAIDWFENLTGVRAAFGGKHPGMGTHNALASLGDGAYLELLAIDPDQDGGLFASVLDGLETPELIAWAAGCNDSTAASEGFTSANIGSTIVPMTRESPDGALLSWEVILPTKPPLGTPFLIDWMQTKHPSSTTPSGIEITEFVIMTPDVSLLTDISQGLDGDWTISQGPFNSLNATMNTPKGEIQLTGVARSLT